MKRISVFIIDKIVIQIRCKHYYLLWIAMDPVDKTKNWNKYFRVKICLLRDSFCNQCYENMEHSVYSYNGTWYPEACKILNVKHYIYSSLEKGLID